MKDPQNQKQINKFNLNLFSHSATSQNNNLKLESNSIKNGKFNMFNNPFDQGSNIYLPENTRILSNEFKFKPYFNSNLINQPENINFSELAQSEIINKKAPNNKIRDPFEVHEFSDNNYSKNFHEFDQQYDPYHQNQDGSEDFRNVFKNQTVLNPKQSFKYPLNQLKKLNGKSLSSTLQQQNKMLLNHTLLQSYQIQQQQGSKYPSSNYNKSSLQSTENKVQSINSISNQDLQAKFMKKLSQNQQTQNCQISEVKYRLDQLMKKFPVNNDIIKVQPNFKKKNNFYFKQHSFQLPRSKSSEHQKIPYQFKTKKIDHQRIKDLKTEDNIALQSNNDSLKNKSEQKLKYSESKPKNSLDYSESVNQSKVFDEVNLNFHIQSLYRQIQDQQNTISSYKQIVFRLQQQKTQLLQIFEQNFNLQSNPSNQIDQSTHQNVGSHLISQPIENCDSNYSDEFHKFQREEVNQGKNPKFQQSLQNLQVQSKNLDFKAKSRISGKFSLSLENKVEILQIEKKQLLSKIDWLNSVIQEMMNMGSRIKNDQSIAIQDPPSARKKQIEPLNPSGQSVSMKQKKISSKQLQTQFSGNFGQQGNYKILYQRSLINQQYLKKQINELSQLQNTYGDQFKMILEQINQIKQNRSFYVHLKEQIKRERQKSNSRDKKNQEKFYHSKYNNRHHKTSTKNCTTYLRNCEQKESYKAQKQNSEIKKIFENKIIYELKRENENLRQMYLKLKKQSVKQVQKRQQIYSKQINLPTPTNQKRFKQARRVQSPLVYSSKNIFLKKINQKRETSKFMKAIDKELRQRPASSGEFNQIKKSSPQFHKIKSEFQRNNNLQTSNIGNYYKSSNVLLHQLSKNEKNFIEDEPNNKFSKISLKQQVEDSGLRDQIRELQNVKPPIKGFQKLEWQNQQRISQKEGQRSSQNKNCNGNQRSVVTRYNNFIKNMKQRFGINSMIAGKQIKINKSMSNNQNSNLNSNQN